MNIHTHPVCVNLYPNLPRTFSVRTQAHVFSIYNEIYYLKILFISAKVKRKRVEETINVPSCSSSCDTSFPIPQADYEAHKKELKAACAKSKSDINHINKLLDEMFLNNQDFIKQLPDGQVKPILQQVPAYTSANYVSKYVLYP